MVNRFLMAGIILTLFQFSAITVKAEIDFKREEVLPNSQMVNQAIEQIINSSGLPLYIVVVGGDLGCGKLHYIGKRGGWHVATYGVYNDAIYFHDDLKGYVVTVSPNGRYDPRTGISADVEHTHRISEVEYLIPSDHLKNDPSPPLFTRLSIKQERICKFWPNKQGTCEPTKTGFSILISVIDEDLQKIMDGRSKIIKRDCSIEGTNDTTADMLGSSDRKQSVAYPKSPTTPPQEYTPP